MICVKCGSEAGWSDPIYRTLTIPGYASRAYCRPPFTSEWLGFECLTCGYERTEPPKDAKPEPPGFPPNRVIREGDEAGVVVVQGDSHAPRPWWKVWA